MKSNRSLAVLALAVLALGACDRTRLADTEEARPAEADVPAAEQPTPAPEDLPARNPAATVSDSGLSFTDMDKNMDSGISRDELGETEALRQHFNDADTNGDGQLSVAEVERYRSDMAGGPKPPMIDTRAFAEMDANSDGAVTPDELWDNEMLSRHFGEADADQDQRLSAAEVDAHRAAMAAGE